MSVLRHTVEGTIYELEIPKMGPGAWHCPRCGYNSVILPAVESDDLDIECAREEIAEHHRSLHSPTDPIASGFASWVFHESWRAKHGRDYEYGIGDSLDDDSTPIDRGLLAHQDLETYFSLAQASMPGGGAWTVVFADPHDGSTNRFFESGLLTVRGRPLGCRPDLVLEERSTGTIFVVERKTTRAASRRIPDSGFEKDKAQLWCYLWIDDWGDHRPVVGVCEYWRLDSVFARAKRGENAAPRLEPFKTTPVLRRDDLAWQHPHLDWFRRWGGDLDDRLLARSRQVPSVNPNT
jgi:hypothetical protein